MVTTFVRLVLMFMLLLFILFMLFSVGVAFLLIAVKYYHFVIR